jgi:hypothetical protein
MRLLQCLSYCQFLKYRFICRYQARQYSTEEIENSFTAFRTSEVCEDLWKVHTSLNARGHNMNYAVAYTYYSALLSMPEISPWAFVCLFFLIFPTGNAVAERGVSAMGAVHSKRRSEMSHEQVLAHMMVQFNGPPSGTYDQKRWMPRVGCIIGGDMLTILIIIIIKHT